MIFSLILTYKHQYKIGFLNTGFDNFKSSVPGKEEFYKELLTFFFFILESNFTNCQLCFCRMALHLQPQTTYNGQGSIHLLWGLSIQTLKCNLRHRSMFLVFASLQLIPDSSKRWLSRALEAPWSCLKHLIFFPQNYSHYEQFL